MRLFIEKIMGKAFSCCCLHKQEVEAVDETSRLLSTTKVNVTGSNGWQTISRPSLGSLTDLLDISDDNNVDNNSENKTIEKELSKKLIDIMSIDQPIDKREWEERLVLYEKRMAKINKPLLLTSKANTDSLTKEPPSERCHNPINVEDLELITYLSEKASEAVLNGFQINCDESVVVPFSPWTRS